MDTEKLFEQAEAGDMKAQYELAEYYGAQLNNTRDAEEIYNFSKQAMNWLKKAAKQGYAPAVDALEELKGRARKENLDVPGTDDIDPEIIIGEAETSDTQGTYSVPAKEEKPRSAAPVKKKSAKTAEIRSEKAEKTKKPDNSVGKKEKTKHSPGVFSTAAGTVLMCLLAVSLIANILLLSILVRTGVLSHDNEPAPTSASDVTVPSEEPDGEQEADPPAETDGEQNAEPSAEPSPEPEQEAEQEWLDLSAHSELKFVPQRIYNDYVYYTVQTGGDSLNVRSGPDTSYESIAGVPNETKIGAVADSEGWYLIYYKGQFGWVYGEYLK